MSEQRRPELRLEPSDTVSVTPGQEFEVVATVKNSTGVIDAFDVFVLGLDEGSRVIDPDHVVALFPGSEEGVTFKITLPDDFPAGVGKLWFKASSQAAPAIDVVQPLTIDVEQANTATITMFPATAVDSKVGRFGVTVENTGNGPLNVSLDAADEENLFTYEIVPPDPQRIEAGATVSFLANLTGTRPLTGAAIPKQFVVIPTSDGKQLTDGRGEPLQARGMFALKPRVPTLALAFAGAVALLGLWAMIVGVALDAVIDDTNDDLATSIEEGLGAVVDELGEEQDATATARDDVLAAAGAGGAGAAGGGAAGEAAAAGLAGQAVGVTAGAADRPDDAPPMEVAPNELAGTLTAGASGEPVVGAEVTAQALLPDGNFVQVDDDGMVEALLVPDPNRPPIVAITDDLGVYRIPDLLPGAYDVVIAVPGYLPLTCRAVPVPADDAPVACTSAGQDGQGTAPSAAGQDGTPTAPGGASTLAAGTASPLSLAGAEATIAGIVTVDGTPFQEETPNLELTITLSRLMPREGFPEGTEGTAESQGFAAQLADPSFEPRTLSTAQAKTRAGPDDALAGSRFSYILGSQPPSTPGTFELLVTAPGFSENRQTFEIGPGQRLITLEVPMVTPIPNATPASERVLSGTVLDDATGAPLGDASVSVVGPAGSFSVSTAAADGTFRLVGAPIGTYSVTITKDGYLPATTQRTVPAGTPAPPPVRLVAAPGSLTGTVTNAGTGAGVAAVTVTLTPEGATATTIEPVTTDVDGRYEFASLAADTYTASYAVAGLDAQTGTVTVAPGEAREANVSLSATDPGGTLNGMVTDLATGAPISGVVIGMTPVVATPPVPTDGSGGFRIEALARDTTYTLTFDAAGYTATTATVRLAAGDQEKSLPVAMTPETSVLTGTVADLVSGLPIAAPVVTITPAHDVAAIAAGSFSFDGLHAQTTYTVTVSAPGYQSETRVVGFGLEPERALAIRLVPLGAVSGTVVVVGPGTPAGMTVTASGPGGPFTTATDPGGAYRFETLPPGSYVLSFTKTKVVTSSVTVTVAGAEVAAPLVLLVALP